MFTKENLNEISNELFLLFITINGSMMNRALMFKGFCFPPSHMKVIFYLTLHGPSPVSKIANDLFISKPNMTPILDTLISEGFARRYDDPSDRRIIIIEPTEKSREFLEQRKQEIISVLSEKLSALNQADLEELKQLLPKLGDIMSRLK